MKVTMKKVLAILSGALAIVLFSVSVASASTVYPTGSNGIDVSYPNCSTKVSPVDFGIVGVTGGLPYTRNNCLAAQAKSFSNLSLYLNASLNATVLSSYYTQAQVGCNGDVYCAAYNYGYNAANEALAYAQSQHVSSDKWWIDVETMNTWNVDTLQNQKSIQGEHDALVAAGATTVGIYSTTAQWGSITGGWLNFWPSWGATTWTTAKQAQTYCTGHEFTGGPSLLMQFKSKRSNVDQDVAC